MGRMRAWAAPLALLVAGAGLVGTAPVMGVGPSTQLARAGEPWAYAWDCGTSSEVVLDAPSTTATPAPQGAGSLLLQAGTGRYQEYPLPSSTDPISNLTHYRVSVRSDEPVVRFLAGVSPSAASTAFVRVAIPVTPGSWTTVDLATQPWEWLTKGTWGSSSTTNGSGTLAEFAAHRTDGRLRPVISLWGCESTSPVQADHSIAVSLDTVNVVTPAGDDTTDYEPANAPDTTLVAPGPRTIVAGQAVTLGTALRYGSGWPIPGRDITLQSAAVASPAWSGANVVATNATGAVASTVKPIRSTSYRWSFAGDEYFAASDSARGEVGVRTRVSSSLVHSSVRRGRTLRMVGSTYPAKPGTVVSLWRRTTVRTLLGHATVNRYGRFAVSAPARRKGLWRLQVTIPATPGNLAGAGPVRTARVD